MNNLSQQRNNQSVISTFNPLTALDSNLNEASTSQLYEPVREVHSQFNGRMDPRASHQYLKL